MSLRRWFLTTTFSLTMLSIFSQPVVRYEGGEIEQEKLDQILQSTPYPLRMKYTMQEGTDKLSELYVLGVTLPSDQSEGLLTDSEIQKQIEMERTKILSQTLYEKEISGKLTITDEEISQYYEEKKSDEFYIPQRYKMQHIFISAYQKKPQKYTVQEGDTLEKILEKYADSNVRAKDLLADNALKSASELKTGMEIVIPGTTDGEKGELMDHDPKFCEIRGGFAQQIREKAIQPDADFAALANQYSQTDQEKKSDEIGPIPVKGSDKQMLPEILGTLAKMKVGDISPVIRTKHGWEILKLTEILPEEQKQFDEVKEAIKQKLTYEKRAQMVEVYIDQLKKASFIKNNIDATLKEDAPKDDALLFQVGELVYTWKSLNDEFKENPDFESYKADKERLAKLIEGKMLQNAIVEQAILNGYENDELVKTKLNDVKALILADAYLEKQVKAVSEPSEEMLKKEYENNLNSYVVPQRYKISQISVKKDSENAKGKMDHIFQMLKEGKKFSDLAKENSQDTFAKYGGEVGYIVDSSRRAEFIEEVKKLKVGDFSTPFMLDDSFFIVQLTEMEQERTRTFEEVKDQILMDLKMKIQAQSRSEIIQNGLEKVKYQKIQKEDQPEVSTEDAPKASDQK